MAILIIIAVIVVLVLIVAGIYNGLVKSRMQTKEAWAQIDVQLKRRNDLIPNLVETVKGYAAHEKTTFDAVTEARAKVAGASNPSEAMEASNVLSGALGRLLAVAEAYPQLQANTNFMQLQTELTNTEDKISVTRQLYNSATANYNTKLQTFPTNLIAGMMGFKEADFFETPEAEKAIPKVDFGV
ncbi:MAG: LemA family protein [Streptococcaceae bacterium]|nr:LemA family protein [Streptococcaceae bacterium]